MRHKLPKSETELLREDLKVRMAEMRRTALIHINDLLNGTNRRIDPAFVADGIERDAAAACRQFIEQVTKIEATLSRQLDPPRSGFGAWMRKVFRTEHISSRRGHGWGCRICHGGIDTSTFMRLYIQTEDGSINADFCKDCTERLAQVVDARLEDKRVLNSKYSPYSGS